MTNDVFNISRADLNADDRASFATSARLLSCLVTESLVDAFYYRLPASSSGFAVIQNHKQGSANDDDDLLAIVPLQHTPILRKPPNPNQPSIITLLDPLDLAPLILVGERKETDSSSVEAEPSLLQLLSIPDWENIHRARLVASLDPVRLWRRFAQSIDMEDALRDDIESEFRSSVKWQRYSFENPAKTPSFSASSVDWEQSIVEGHPTHPMHKTRRFLPPIPDFHPGEYDLLHPKLRFIAMPRKDIKITYNFEELLQPALDAASRAAKKPLSIPEGRIVIPVHELQVHHIREKFPEAHIFPEEFSLPLLAQQSLRSVVLPDAFRDLHLKLGVGMKLTSAVRTISPESAYLGPRFSAQVVPVLTMDRSIVTVARELASVVHSNPDGEIAKHCAALIREYHEGTSEDREEHLIVCTSLVESGHDAPDGQLPAVIRIFGLDSEAKREEWFEKFVDVFFRAFLPSVLHNGVAFECHPQNCVARFDVHTRQLKGFIIRDFGGLRVHPETLKATTGVDLDFIKGHSIIAPDLDDVYTRMYHTVFHNHLQQLIRVLGLHYNGKGWAIVRNQLSAVIPHDHPLHAAWLSPERTTVPGKCFMRMRMSGMYRHHLHGPFPNLIHYRGIEHDNIEV